MYLPDTPSLSVKASDGDIARATMRALPAIFQRRIERARNGSEAKALVGHAPSLFLEIVVFDTLLQFAGCIDVAVLKISVEVKGSHCYGL